MHCVIYPDVLIEFLPAQGQPSQAQLDFFQSGLWSIREQRIFRGRKADHALVIKFEPDTAAFHPTAQGGDWR